MHIIKLLLFIVLISFTSCKTHLSKNEKREIIKNSQSYKQIIKDKNLEIVIEDALSYKYDLTKEVFTIFFMGKAPTSIHFDLTVDEKNNIIDKYYELGINQITGKDEITGKIYIEDKCMELPKLTTLLKVKTKNELQLIEIDTGCDDYYQPFYLSNYNIAKRVKKFLHFVLTIIYSKPSLKNFPQSDIMYM